MKPACRLVARRLPGSLSARAEDHVAECLVCQAAVARYRRLTRELASLASVIELAPVGLAEAVEHAVHTAGRPGLAHGSTTARSRILAASAMAATAGVIAVAALRRRLAA